MINTCRNCKFWVKPVPGEKEDVPTGICGLISEVDENGRKDYRINMSRAPAPIAWMTSANFYFRTKPEFYCAMWMQKDA